MSKKPEKVPKELRVAAMRIVEKEKENPPKPNMVRINEPKKLVACGFEGCVCPNGKECAFAMGTFRRRGTGVTYLLCAATEEWEFKTPEQVVECKDKRASA